MERTMASDGGGGPPDYVLRSRLDARVACLPRQLHRTKPYIALQDDLWGSDALLYGDYRSMEALCARLAPRYDEYTAALGHASSEPMMLHHLEQEELRLVRFPRCVCIDRT
eukprot:807942-Prymnesium_polylepis.1